MAVKRRHSNSKARSAPGLFKWIIKSILVQVGCLSKQDFDEEFVSNGNSFENLIDNVDNSTSKNQQKNLNKNKRMKVTVDNESFVENVKEYKDSATDDKKNKDKSGGGIMSFQNCTLQCAQQDNGESYWVSFEEKSFSKGEGFKVYSGRMNGKGPKSGERCVVKVFRQCQGTENMCLCEVKKCNKAKSLAKDFNNLMHNKKLRVKFTTVYWAFMDEVSKIKKLFYTGVRKLSTHETVLFEDDLRVNDDKPHKHRELTLFMDCNGMNKTCVSKDLNAFAHFTYHKSNGALVLCGLDGVQDDDGFFLKTPTIHSRKHEYGHSDRGLQGILDVFKYHVCSDFCKDMIKPIEDLNNLATDCKSDLKCEVPSSASNTNETTNEKVSNCNHHHPVLTRQDSVVSEESLVSENTVLWRQCSSISQVTESFSGYLEPSAPFEDFDVSVFQPSPPPYSSVNVANWLLHEYAENTFIGTSLNQQMPYTGPGDLVNQMSVESGLGASVFTSCDDFSLRGTSLDLNANFPEDNTDTSGVSTSGCFDGCEEHDRAISIQGCKKRVQFSLSSGVYSNNLSSETSASATSDSLIEMHRMRSDCPRIGHCPPIHGHHCAGSFLSSNNQDNMYGSSHLIKNCFSMPIGGSSNIPHEAVGTHIQESPPSYTDSERRAGWSFLQRKFLSENGNNIKAGSHEIGQQNMVISNSVQRSMENKKFTNNEQKK